MDKKSGGVISGIFTLFPPPYDFSSVIWGMIKSAEFASVAISVMLARTMTVLL